MVREKIEDRMNALQHWMETNYHLKNPNEVYDLTTQISKFWSILNDEDKDYIQAAQHAIEDKIKWRIKDE